MHVDTMAAAIEAKFDAVMNQAFAPHACAYAGLVEQIDCALLENARADPRFRMLARLGFKNDGIDAFEMEQVREHQTGWPGADDTDLSAEASGHGQGHRY
jgi:hypothetical protein